MCGLRIEGDVLKGMAWMLASTILFSGMHLLIRMTSDELHPLVIIFYRNLFGFVVLFPAILRYGRGVLKTTRPGLMVTRSAFNYAAMALFFWALTISPLAQVTALSFTFPIFLALLAMVFLGERVGPRRWMAILLGFAGALIVVRPGFQAVALGDLMTLVSALFWAVTMLLIKMLSRTESSLTITIYMMGSMLFLSVPTALMFWTWPSPETFILLFLLGALGTAGQWALTESLRLADTSVVTPVDYARLIWIAAIGFFVFGEVPDLAVWGGGILIAASASYIAYRERKAAAPAGDANGPGQSGGKKEVTA